MTRHNDHIRAEELMSAYLDQRLAAEEKRFLEQHLAACADCRAQLEATRSLVTALKALPVVKAPRSFVLPREMAKQPKRSIFNWYPALRLATVVAALAFAILFAGDLLIGRSGSSAPGYVALPAAAPAPQVMLDQTQAQPTTEAAEQPREPAANAQDSTATTGAAVLPTEAPAPAPAAGGPAAKAAITATATVTESMAMSALAPEMTPTPEATEIARAEAAPPGAGSAVPSAESVAATSTIDPLRVLEIALLGLVIVLGAATLIVRRRQV